MENAQTDNSAACGQSRSTAGLCVGSKVRLLKGIYDHGEDHHPPGWIAHAGEVLVVRYIGSEGDAGFVAVSHEDVTDKSFWILRGEFETHNDLGNRRAAFGASVLTDELAGND